ncbi:hypothetical protein [Actinomadura roseirufa]|uniref:hypothetical protein n=1 Tax=Actinomadura roseirufa TaxID=2094049 RepID=UPI001041AFFD|nr:hypothetical protein [Actinomadura roseirufa]
MSTIRQRAAVALVLVLGIGTTATAQASAAPASPHAVKAPAHYTWYPKHVKSNVNNVTVFTSPGGGGSYGTWGACHNFEVDRTDPPYNRYHTTWGSADAWVTSDSDYIADGWC